MSWEQVGNTIRFGAFFVASKVGKAGLADVTVDVRNPAGTEVVTGGSATDVGDGFYTYDLSAGLVTSAGMYLAVFKTADGNVDQQHVPSAMLVGLAGVEFLDASVAARTPGLVQRAEPDNAGIAAIEDALTEFADPLENAVPGTYGAGTAGYALGRIGSGTITVTQPVSSNGALLSLVRGDDYKAEDGRAITFTSTRWPDLTSATELRITVRRRVEAFGGDGEDSVWATSLDEEADRIVGAETQSLTFVLTAAQTAEMVPATSAGKFDVQATIAGRVVTLLIGRVTVLEDQTR